MKRPSPKRSVSPPEVLVGLGEGGSNLLAPPSHDRHLQTVFARLKPERGEPDWEQVAADLQISLATDLIALGLALRRLSMTGPPPAAPPITPRLPAPPAVLPRIETPLPDPPDAAARFAMLDLRLAEVRRSLGIVAAVDRTTREQTPYLEPPATSRVFHPSLDSTGHGTAPAIVFPSPPTEDPVRGNVTRRTNAAHRRKRPRRPKARSASAKPTEDVAAPEPAPSPAVGGPGQSSITAFLQTNRTERFDIQMLNALPLPRLLEEAHGDLALFTATARQAEDLMLRVKHEVDDPQSAGAFLRDQVHRWHEKSGQDPEWTTRMPAHWAGLFADSRVHGGRLELWLSHRLWILREEAIRGGPLRQKLARKLGPKWPAEAAVGRTATEQIRAEVAQAILDDLATHVRHPQTPLPLIYLSELAIRRQVVTVNEALAQLFSVPETGPFIILHPNRYPDCEEVMIRPPVPKARGAALAYSLASGRPPPSAPARERRDGVPARSATGPDEGPRAEPAPTSGLDAETIWEAESVHPAAWKEVVGETRDARERLAAPPQEFRTRAAYITLCELLLDDPAFRKTFLAVRWRGRPTGLPLFAALLQEASFASTVSTDHEYLEAELGDLVRANLGAKTSDGIWTVKDWTITREGSHRDGFRFRAQRGP